MYAFVLDRSKAVSCAKQNPFLSRCGKKRFLMPKKGNKGKTPLDPSGRMGKSLPTTVALK